MTLEAAMAAEERAADAAAGRIHRPRRIAPRNAPRSVRPEQRPGVRLELRPELHPNQ